MRNVLDFGADPTGVLDSTSAILSACSNGGKVFFPAKADGTKSTYRVFGSGNYALPLNTPVELIGENCNSSILADASIPSTRSVIGFKPTSCPSPFRTDANGWGITDLTIEPQAGCQSPNALIFDTTVSGQWIWMANIRNVNFGTFSGPSIVSVNSNSDGLFNLDIRRCLIPGGIFLNSVGDSVHIENNQLWGNGIGIFASFVPGAGCMTIKGNNIINWGGCVYLISPAMVKIEENNMELDNGYQGQVDSMVYLSNAQVCDITHNQMQSLGQAGCVRLDNCNRTFTSRNQMFAGLPHKHIFTNGGTNNTQPDNRYVDSSSGLEVSGYF